MCIYVRVCVNVCVYVRACVRALLNLVDEFIKTGIVKVNPFTQQYIGEISFFDHRPRSATVIATEDTEVVKIPPAELKKQVPKWLVSTAIQMITKLRETDDVIQENGIRKRMWNPSGHYPLMINECIIPQSKSSCPKKTNKYSNMWHLYNCYDIYCE